MNNFAVKVWEHPQKKDITLLTVQGPIDGFTAPEVVEKFRSVLGENRFKLVFDLTEVNYISSAGWGIFIHDLKRIRTQKGDLLLAGMVPEVSQVYEIMDFKAVLKSFPNVESAVQKGFQDS